VVGVDALQDCAADVVLSRSARGGTHFVEPGEVGWVKAEEHARPLTIEGLGFLHASMISKDIGNVKIRSGWISAA